MKTHLILATLALTLAFALVPDAIHAQLAAPGECYGTTGTFSIIPGSDLVRIDTATGATVLVGPTGAGTVPAQYLSFPGLAIDSQGRLFAAHSSGFFAAGRDAFLYTISAATGAAAVAAPLSGGVGQGISALAFDENDVLYAVKTSTDELITIDVATG
ncbi:MAG TPA: hypothetical protein VIL33_00345, partial [Rhodothermia bacterium]